MAKLLRLHAAAGQLAEDAPAVIAHPEAARGLEQALIEAMVACLDVGEVREDRSALRQHALILRRFRRAVEENPDRPFTSRSSVRRSECRTGHCGSAARSTWG